MPDAESNAPSPSERVRPAQVVADLVLVGMVPLVLAAIHLLVPSTVQEQYVLRPDAAPSITLFTAAFLHVSDSHLVANAVGYALGALAAYLVCLRLVERRWFWLSTLTLVLGLPVVVNWTSLHVLALYFGDWSARIRGFSGVAAGFGGFAVAALLAFVARRTDRWSALFSGLAVALLLFWEVLVVYTEGVPPLATGLVALGVGLCLVQVFHRWYRRGLPASRAGWIDVGRGVSVFVWTLLVVAVIVASLFPADVVHDDGITNVFAHAAGFGYGFVVTGWGYRYWRIRRSG